MILLIKALVSTVVTFLIIALVLFLPAGTNSVACWLDLLDLVTRLYAGEHRTAVHLQSWLAARAPQSLPTQSKTWDKALTPVNSLLCLVWAILMPLDAVRFHWSHMPLFLQIVGAIVLVGSFPLIILTFRETRSCRQRCVFRKNVDKR